MPTQNNSIVSFNHLEHIHDNVVQQLEELALELRKSVIEMLTIAGSGHTAGALGLAEIYAALYFYVLKNVDPQKPKNPERDRLLVSNGHTCPILYATLAYRGYFSKKELKALRKLDSILQGHPHNLTTPGVENSGGPLAQGLSQAAGVALAALMDNKSYRTYVITGDGELNEGAIWEAAMFAAKYKLANLTWIIDRNNIQIDGYTQQVMPLENLREKLEAFNWYVEEINAHNIREFIEACEKAKSIKQRPTAIIAHSIPGKDVDFMEYKVEWHGMSPDQAQANKALQELNILSGKIRSTHE
ncbi:transketolase [candidate division WWE3 bacterium]|uniref:Transketolase n=1 Tax=candidate division WWE3 bacterium TaxID=2053526 RepID=A0A955J1N8_UNCKA|nr:transketolase [candidate division WWE3 bacterium]